VSGWSDAGLQLDLEEQEGIALYAAETEAKVLAQILGDEPEGEESASPFARSIASTGA
jgi:hypothetical protein